MNQDNDYSNQEPPEEPKPEPDQPDLEECPECAAWYPAGGSHICPARD